MIKGADDPPPAIHGQIACRPDCRRPHIAGENRVWRGEAIKLSCQVLWMDWILSRFDGEIVQTLSRVPIMLARSPQMLFVVVLL